MASLWTQNALLFVIAPRLVLIVVHLYSGHVVSKAQVQTSGSQDVHLYAWGCDTGGGGCSWRTVKLDEYGSMRTTK